jgi:hypothetical protein
MLGGPVGDPLVEVPERKHTRARQRHPGGGTEKRITPSAGNALQVYRPEGVLSPASAILQRAATGEEQWDQDHD